VQARTTLIESMKQHRLVEEKVQLFWTRYSESDNEVGRNPHPTPQDNWAA
jgi:hypothetical protein